MHDAMRPAQIVDTTKSLTGRRAFLALSLGVALSIDGAHAADRPADGPFTIGTSTPGGGFSLYGETLERVLNRRAGREVVRAQPTRGSTENLALLDSGAIDAALIQGTAASELFAGGTGGSLCILYAMYPSPGMLAVPTASDVHRYEDLLGRRVVFGVRTSGLVTLGRQVFSGIGIDIDRDLQAIFVDQAVESPRIVLAGRAEGLWGAGEGWPGFTQLAQSAGGARFIGPAPGQIEKIVERFPLLKPIDVQAGAYPGIERALHTVGSVNLVLARADLDAARAARFVEAMHAAEADLAAALPQAVFSTLANTLASAASASQLHRVLQGRR